ncbi:MAG: hypothetical protein FIB06_03580 [Betaproteobacteria bacterium]|nr:hypothetical protein [Betaproteobacteria bacterium]
MTSILALTVITLAAVATVVFVGILKPVSATAYALFALWLLLPAIVIAASTLTARRRGRPVPAGEWLLGAAVAAGGALMLADILFWHRDAQGGIAVLMVPLLQLPAWFALRWVLRRRAPTAGQGQARG